MQCSSQHLLNPSPFCAQLSEWQTEKFSEVDTRWFVSYGYVQQRPIQEWNRWRHVCCVNSKLLQEENRLWKFLCSRILLQQPSLCLFPCRGQNEYHTLGSPVGACLGPQRKSTEDSIMICPHSAISRSSRGWIKVSSPLLVMGQTELQESKWWA